MKRALALAVGAAASFLFAALLYVTDPDVDGIQGLGSFEAVSTVLVLSTIPLSLIGAVLVFATRFGTSVGIAVLVLLAAASAFLILIASQPTLSFPVKLAVMARSTLFVCGVLALGTLPHWLGLFKSRRDRRASD